MNIHLRKFSKCISVREASSVKICSALWNRQDAQPVLDPTLLLDKDDWSKVSKRPNLGPGLIWLR